MKEILPQKTHSIHVSSFKNINIYSPTVSFLLGFVDQYWALIFVSYGNCCVCNNLHLEGPMLHGLQFERVKGGNYFVRHPNQHKTITNRKRTKHSQTFAFGSRKQMV